MADLVIDASTVRLVRGSDEVLYTGPVGETGLGGEYYRLNTTTAYLENGNATQRQKSAREPLAPCLTACRQPVSPERLPS